MERNTNPSIIDAAARFAERRQEAQLMDVSEDLRVVNSCVVKQPSAFFNYLSTCSAEVATELKDDLWMKSAVVVDSEIPEVPSPSGVYYWESEPGVLEPNLMITDKDVTSMAVRLEPLTSRIDYPAPKPYQMEVATVALSWLHLGAWAFERLDPRRHGSIDTSPSAFAFWAEMTKLPLGEEFTEETANEQVKNAALVLKWRVAGASTYKGLTQSGLITSGEIIPFQRMYKSMFDVHVRNEPQGIKQEDFALANPLTAQEMKRLLSMLGQVQ